MKSPTNLTPLNKKETKNIIELIDKTYLLDKNKQNNFTTKKFSESFMGDLLLDPDLFTLYINRKNKIYITNKQSKEIDKNKLKVMNIGIYLGELMRSEFRPSVEGSQIIAEFANKNILEINEHDFKEYMNGFDIFLEDKYDLSNLSDHAFVILVFNKNPIGAAKRSGDRLINFLSKGRRLQTMDIPD